MTITSLSFSFVQYTATAAMADAKAAASVTAPTPAAQRDGCHRSGCDSPRHSPLYRALKDALLEMTQATQPAANDTTTPSTTTAGSATTASATSTTSASATPATVTEDAAPATESAAPSTAAPDLEHAMMDFARALMQALRSGFQQGQGDDGGHEGHHHHHHHGHGRRAWGDPAQRVDALAQQVGAGTTSNAPAAPAPSTGNPADAATPAAAADPAAVADAATAAATSSATPSQSTPQNTVIFVATINNQPSAAAQASPFSTLFNAFAGLQQAMGKAPEAGDSLKSELSTFLQTLAQRLRGEDAATAEATTQPGALLSVAA